jgi:oligopeptide transport system substrate-binding protein
MGKVIRSGAVLLLTTGLMSCGIGKARDPVTITIVGKDVGTGQPDRMSLSTAARVMNGAVAQGLVAFDASGQVEPALAERWIVTSDGLSYIFRIREATWADGRPVASAEVAQSLRAHMVATSRNSLRPLFSGVSGVIPMTGQVVEIRLRSPEPNFLQLLAQPEMAIFRAGVGTGPYRVHSKRDGVVRLRPAPVLGEPIAEQADPNALQSSDIRLRGESTALGTARFQASSIAYLAGGTFADLPIANAASLDATEFELDGAYGLFGFIVMDNGGVLADRAARTALSLAVERETLLQRFGVSDWQPAISILPRQLDSASAPGALAVMQQPYRERLLRARALLAGKQQDAVIRVAMPEGPGARLLFAKLASDWKGIGFRAVRVSMTQAADIRLIDEVAPFSSAIWYLRRLACSPGIICSAEADIASAEASVAPDLAARSAAIARADAALVANQSYIPLSLPLRWSLVSPELTGWKPSAFANHPLRHLRPAK